VTLQKSSVTALAYCNLTLRRNKSFADDLNVDQGAVSSRVALLLRSAEAKPLTPRFVEMTISPTECLLASTPAFGRSDLELTPDRYGRVTFGFCWDSLVMRQAAGRCEQPRPIQPGK
jgi:hypothetical protein